MIDGRPIAMDGRLVQTILVRDLTTAGHNLLASMEQADVWNQLKRVLTPAEVASLSLKQLSALILELSERAIRKKLGLD
ncbi:hypothetical protein [Roseinatronobacter alkalisoli]|uniref:Uncharacterized protein n=1 Tax=Roseinatronobacter alkalisoli TaxID=3028235 RepID=A0ABT5TBH1_9RHOB|nr:hypothetical protein [Roseinatronobacter sp. HJB301]MDD7972478.1 hypothetical protein [Roseinatronobacter sp. HJB301]